MGDALREGQGVAVTFECPKLSGSKLLGLVTRDYPTSGTYTDSHKKMAYGLRCNAKKLDIWEGGSVGGGGAKVYDVPGERTGAEILEVHLRVAHGAPPHRVHLPRGAC